MWIKLQGKGVQNAGRWPCGVCGRGIGINSVPCSVLTVRNRCIRSVVV